MTSSNTAKNKNDEVIAERVRKQIEQSTTADIDQIEVKVEDGVVTLQGTVSEYPITRALYEAAFYTVGVKRVKDELVIKYEEKRRENKI